MGAVVRAAGWLLAWLAATGPAWARSGDADVELPNRLISRIAFGSYNDHTDSQDIWNEVLLEEPDLWIWAGDVVLSDTRNLARLRSDLSRQSRNQNYRRLLHTAMIIGTWNKRDCVLSGTSRPGADLSRSRQYFLDFLAVPKDDPRREREGVYASYSLGPEHSRLRVILLDTRSFSDKPGLDGDLLGNEQWKWLQHQLFKSAARITLIVSPIPFVAGEHAGPKWKDWPESKMRLVRMIQNSGKGGILFLSGDSQGGEISKFPAGQTSYPLYDVSSSGLTRKKPVDGNAPNKYRLGTLCRTENFGVVEIAWDADPPRINLKIRGVNMKTAAYARLVLDELAVRE